MYNQGEFILAYYGSNRTTYMAKPLGVEKIKLKDSYAFDENPSQVFLKYLVDLKTQQSFARNENDIEVVENIENWFNKFENAMRIILDDDSDMKHLMSHLIKTDSITGFTFHEYNKIYDRWEEKQNDIQKDKN